ncbi:MAG: HAMP domain-containing histidine kinase [Methylococcaceae bacterium]|nr:HAMP domain-containing histidine kinase [Methylococcaceae bacterium]
MLTHVIPKSAISTRENLQWLFILRNLMLGSESLLIIISVYGLYINLPQEMLWIVVMATGVVNLYTWMRLQTDTPVTESELFSQLCVDVFAIAGILYLSGGASNPITWVFLVPLIITAITLSQSYAWYMVLLTTTMYTLLIRFNIPLPSIEPHELQSDALNSMTMHQLHLMQDKHYFNLHIFGMWFGFVFSAIVVAFFVVELANTLRERERRLAEARENALRNERIVALGVLAASAAHDMGTPLGTMAIITHELTQNYPEHRHPELSRDLKILQQQILRCKEALSVMSASGGEMRAESGNSMSAIEYLDGVLNQWRSHNPSTKLNLMINPATEINAKIIAEQTLTHALINVLNNAAEVSPANKGIDFHAEWDEYILYLKIRDYGPGLPEELLAFIGTQPVNSNKQGLGVGLFLTCTTVKRLHGKIDFQIMPSGGTSVNIELPLLFTDDRRDHNYDATPSTFIEQTL